MSVSTHIDFRIGDSEHAKLDFYFSEEEKRDKTCVWNKEEYRAEKVKQDVSMRKFVELDLKSCLGIRVEHINETWRPTEKIISWRRPKGKYCGHYCFQDQVLALYHTKHSLRIRSWKIDKKKKEWKQKIFIRCKEAGEIQSWLRGSHLIILAPYTKKKGTLSILDIEKGKFIDRCELSINFLQQPNSFQSLNKQYCAFMNQEKDKILIRDPMQKKWILEQKPNPGFYFGNSITLAKNKVCFFESSLKKTDFVAMDIKTAWEKQRFTLNDLPMHLAWIHKRLIVSGLSSMRILDEKTRELAAYRWQGVYALEPLKLEEYWLLPYTNIWESTRYLACFDLNGNLLGTVNTRCETLLSVQKEGDILRVYGWFDDSPIYKNRVIEWNPKKKQVDSYFGTQHPCIDVINDKAVVVANEGSSFALFHYEKSTQGDSTLDTIREWMQRWLPGVQSPPEAPSREQLT